MSVGPMGPEVCLSNQNEDRGGEAAQMLCEWKWVRGVNKSRQIGSERLAKCLALWTCPFLYPDKLEEKAGRLPDAEVRAARVISAHGGHSASVGANVTWPGLGDVEGAVGIQPHAGEGLHVDRQALLFPDVPGTQCWTSVSWLAAESIKLFNHTDYRCSKWSFLKTNCGVIHMYLSWQFIAIEY